MEPQKIFVYQTKITESTLNDNNVLSAEAEFLLKYPSWIFEIS